VLELPDRLPTARFHPCGHDDLQHLETEGCSYMQEAERIERQRLAQYGPCAWCEYGLPFSCNHPFFVGD
jgi:hypothetical protein